MTAFLGRPIAGDWPYLWIDATCVKVRPRAVGGLTDAVEERLSALLGFGARARPKAIFGSTRG